MPYVANSLSLILLGIRLKEVFLSKRFAHILQRRNCAGFFDLKKVNVKRRNAFMPIAKGERSTENNAIARGISTIY